MGKVSQNDIINKITEILNLETKGLIKIMPSSHLQNDLHLDSVGAIRLIARLEAEFNIMFEFSDSPPKTVDQLATLVESLIIE